MLRPERGSYTCIGSEGSNAPTVIGQVAWEGDSPSANLSFFAPFDLLNSTAATAVLDELVCKAGDKGAFHVLAELDETNPFFEVLHNAGFSAYAWQRIWKIDAPHLVEKPTQSEWHPASSEDAFAIRALFQSQVPPVIQGIEHPMPQHSPAWVLHREGELVGYAEGVFGARGICIYSLFPPDLENMTHALCDLLGQITAMGRPVYMVVRLYQAHIERNLREIGAIESPLVAVLVKHLTLLLREEVAVKQRTAVAHRQAEPTVGMTQNITREEPKF
jgi:hypothetical protein